MSLFLRELSTETAQVMKGGHTQLITPALCWHRLKSHGSDVCKRHHSTKAESWLVLNVSSWSILAFEPPWCRSVRALYDEMHARHPSNIICRVWNISRFPATGLSLEELMGHCWNGPVGALMLYHRLCVQLLRSGLTHHRTTMDQPFPRSCCGLQLQHRDLLDRKTFHCCATSAHSSHQVLRMSSHWRIYQIFRRLNSVCRARHLLKQGGSDRLNRHAFIRLEQTAATNSFGGPKDRVFRTYSSHTSSPMFCVNRHP